MTTANLIEIDLSKESELENGTLYTELPDGGIEIDFSGGEEGPVEDDGDHHANLAEFLPGNVLNRIAEQVIEWVDADKEARLDWRIRFEDGLREIGMIPEPGSGVFEGASRVTHPLIMEACVQFQARAIKEIMPPTGPAKAIVLGKKTEEREEQANRVADFMNYQIMVDDHPAYFEDMDQMLFWLPLNGSMFRKSYYDQAKDKIVSRYIKPDDVLVPYTASNLEDSPRIIHTFKISQDDLRRHQEAGFYADVLVTMPDGINNDDQGTAAFDQIDGRSPSMAEGDEEHTIYECHCEYAIPEREGHAGGVLPYIITVEKDSRTVLAIRRNWKESDERKKKRGWFTHYRYLPGLGFYGFGLIHAIGGLANAGTGALRALLDSAAFANMQGGFKAKDARVKGSEINLKPGVYQDIDMTAEELAKAFYTPPFKEPSKALVELLGILTDFGKSFATTTDVMTGDANNSGPVGTTLALIEQASYPFSAIHKRLHVSLAHELRLRAELNAEYLPAFYPYEVKGGSQYILKSDFDERVDVVPVSDPNIFSNAQRIATAQAVLELAGTAPQIYDTYEAHRRMLEVLRVADIEEVLPNPNDIKRSDPISEGSYLMIGRPVRAHVDEDHEAHLLVHQQQIEFMAGSPMEKIAQPALMAHMAEHYALMYQLQMSQALGMDLPHIDLTGRKRAEMPTEVDNAIAYRAAMAVQAMKQQQQTQEQAAMQQQQADMMDQRNAEFEAEQQMRNQEVINDIDRKDVLQAADFLRKQGAVDVDPVKFVQVARKLGRSFDEALAIIRNAQMGGQGQGPAPLAERVAIG